MSSRYHHYSGPRLFAEEPPVEYTRADRRLKRFTDCTECRAKDPYYTGCNHPEEADKVHPSGGPAIGRVDHQNPTGPEAVERELRKLVNLELSDLFSGVCYPTFISWLLDLEGVPTNEADVPESLRVCLTQADERIVRETLNPLLESKVMLRVRALNEILLMNIGEIPKSLLIFTTHGLLIGAASDKRANYAGGIEVRGLASVLAYTYRSASVTLQSGYNVLYPTTSNEDSEPKNAEAEAKTSKYTNTDHIVKSYDPKYLIRRPLPVPILRQKNYVANEQTGAKGVKSLLVVSNATVTAIEYLREGLLVAVLGFELDKWLKENTSQDDRIMGTSEERQAAAEEKKAKDEEKEYLLDELEEWGATFAAYLRQELKEFRMEISK